MGEIINDQPIDEEIEQPTNERVAGTPEGAVATEPTTAEIGDMYKELGIKAPAPTGATKGRPKSTQVRAEDDKKNPAGDSDSGKKEENADDKSKSKDAPASNKDVDSGNDSDTKGKKVGKDSAEVSDESEETDEGVRGSKSRSESDSKRGSEESPEQRTERVGQEEHDAGAASEEEELDEEGVKRPGKSNPKVEQRFQKLNAELKARDELIEKQAQELREATQKYREEKVSAEDPEYTVEDFSKVRDDEGNILDLDPNQAELAYRRWKDGFEGRSSERAAEVQRQEAVETRHQEVSERIMRSSVQAYDTLTNILDTYPELNKNSDKFDQDFSDSVLPIIEDAILYQPGTEPGNKEGYKSVVVGMKMNPNKILEAMNRVKNAKRTLSLNGLNDNVDVRSNVNVPHSRSSDATVNAANELYKELGINKRL